LFPRFARYSSKQSTEATKLYLDLAKDIGISLTTLALAFVNQRPFVTSNIIGATNLTQLKENIDSINTRISKETLDRIDAIHAIIPNPAP
jgi:aryl-alcohol dehydrogenase-like predicted oxidoreductase